MRIWTVRRPVCLALAAAIAAALVPAAGAQATVTVGSPMSAAFTPLTLGAPAPATVGVTSLPEPGAYAASPINGTVVTWRLTGAAGGPFRLRVLRPAAGGAYTGAGSSSPQTPSNTGLQAFATNLPIQAGDLTGLDYSNPSDQVGVVLNGATFVTWVPPLADGSTQPGTPGGGTVELAFNAEVQPDSLRFGKVTRNKGKGTAKLTANVPGAGVVSLTGTGLKKATKIAAAAGEVTLPVKAKGKKKKRLNENGKTKVTATVKFRFSLAGLLPSTQNKKLTLRKRL